METIGKNSAHLEATFSTEPAKIYELLINGAKFGDVTGMAGKGEDAQGAFFSLFGDFITRRQIQLIENEGIVQASRMMDWETGLYSMVQFNFFNEGDKTNLTIDHYDNTERHHEHISTNREPFYLAPIAKHFETSLV